MRWYNPKRWFNPTTGIVVAGILVFVVFIGAIIVGLSLWDVPFAKQIFPFLEISEVFPTKVIALFTVLATLGTLVLAFGTFLAIRQTRETQTSEKRERLLNEIIEWASEGRRRFLFPLPWTTPGDRSDSKRELGWVTAKKGSATRGAKIFGSKLLLPVVEEAAINLDLFINFLEDIPKEKSHEHVTPLELKKRCMESFIKVLDTASNLKIELNA